MPTYRPSHLLVTIVLALAVSTTGCRATTKCGDTNCETTSCRTGLFGRLFGNKCRRPCDFPPGAIPPPAGTYLNGVMAAQDDLAESGEFVIYEREWYRGGDELGPEGLEHVAEISARLPEVPYIVVVERASIHIPPDVTYAETLDTAVALNETRRREVVTALAEAGIADADARVVIGPAPADPLLGEEAPRAFRQFLRGGQRGGQGGFGGGGFGGGGFGGGGFGGGGFGGGFGGGGIGF